MSNNFVKAIEFTLPWEAGRDRSGRLRQDGGYTNDPKDPGGETKWGISKRAHPDLDIKNLSLDTAFQIYKSDYYDIYKIFKNDPLDLDSESISFAVSIFDSGVNCGVNRTYNWYLVAKKEKDPTAKLLSLRLDHYNTLKPKLPQYYNGWINRLNDLKKFVTIIQT